ncbi:MAG: Uma2 family endonuclease [Thermosynechococcaceae cyanobacterium]
MDTFTLDIAPFIEMTDDQFFDLCQHHRDYRFERTASGALIIMPPTGGETSRRNLSLSGQLYQWNQSRNLGVAFDSSGGFKLPNGADRSPDASWVLKQRWDDLTPQQRKKFLPLCPDFVLELRSPSDAIAELRQKMQEYIANGARLGWLLDPQTQQVEIFRPDQAPEILRSPKSLSGDPVLPGFVLDLTDIFDA